MQQKTFVPTTNSIIYYFIYFYKEILFILFKEPKEFALIN